VKTLSLGALARVDLRDAWQNEASDFTPWLADNIALVGQAISLDLEVEAQEKDVGPFRADILCKEVGTERWVLIENQLERTDHNHLGQLLTYAAGLDAVTIVWVAQRFTDEHRAALDWLNEITDERFSFFGLEVELWRIGASPPAPKLNVVSKPNDWTRSVAEGARKVGNQGLTDSRQVQLDYWTTLRELLEKRSTSLKLRTPQPQRWQSFSIGRSGIQLNAIRLTSSDEGKGGGEIRAELQLSHKDAKAYFEILARRKAEIERAFGEPLVWYNPTDAHNCRIYVRRSADVANRSAWQQQHEWLAEKLEGLREVFQPLVKALDASGLVDDGGAVA
jgi:hypothetical protein